MAVGDVYRLVTNAGYSSGQSSGKLVFHYQVTADSGDLTAENVADEWQLAVLPELLALHGPHWVWNDIQTTNLNDLEDWNNTNPSATGTRSGEPLPPFVAIAVRGPRADPGRHRNRHFLFGGMESDTDGGGVWNADITDEINDACLALGAALEHSNGALSPCTIASPFKLGDTPVVRDISLGIWSYGTRMTTMNSRKTANPYVAASAS